MPDDLPAWGAIMASIITAISGGGLGAWWASRGASKEGDASKIDARTRAEAEGWNIFHGQMKRLSRQSDRLEADLKRERAERKEDRLRFEKRIAHLEREREKDRRHFERERQEDRKRFAEYDETMRIIVAWADEISEPLPVELGI